MRTLQRANLAIRRDPTLGDLMHRLAAIHGDRLVVDEPGAPDLRLTYRQSAKRVARWAGGIGAQIEPGDRVVVAAPNGYRFFLLCLAASRAGGIVVPVNPLMRPDEVRHVIDDSGASFVVRAPEEVDSVDPLLEPEPSGPDDVAALFYTSGTTGKPKGARLTHRALVGQTAAMAMYPNRLRHDEAVLALPVAHIMGFAVLAGFATAGIPVHLLPEFHPKEVLDAIEERRASIFVGVPAMYRMMLEAGAADRDLSSVRLWASGADVMPEDLARQFKHFGAAVTLPVLGRSFGDAAFAEGYGLVEVGGGVAAKISPPMFDFGVGDFLGFALPGYEMRVVDEEGEEVRAGEVGELLVRGPGVLKGYHHDEERTAEVLTDDGWLRTGDLARRGRFGVVRFAGRQKDVVMHGGYSVFAVEVEKALEEHPAVAEAAVVGLPDDRVGEVPAAAVRLVDGAELTEDALLEWAHEHMAEYKAPRRVVFVEEFVRTGTNKVQKSAVRALFSPPA
jgi:acyl-CoA synthetase (AMP-forming)/AMP-acid ligase II